MFIHNNKLYRCIMSDLNVFFQIIWLFTFIRTKGTFVWFLACVSPHMIQNSMIEISMIIACKTNKFVRRIMTNHVQACFWMIKQICLSYLRMTMLTWKNICNRNQIHIYIKLVIYSKKLNKVLTFNTLLKDLKVHNSYL